MQAGGGLDAEVSARDCLLIAHVAKRRMWGSACPQRAAAAATAERVAAEQAAQRMALLERPLGVDVEILNAFFDGASWLEAFDQFFATHCPSFADFGDGTECSLELTAIHRQFTTTADALLDKQLGEMAVSADTFMSTLMSTLNDASPQSTRMTMATNVLEHLDECADFEKFGAMMRARHKALHHTPREVNVSEEEEIAREQQQIRDASERRRRARVEAMRRAEEAADELDAESERHRSTQQESCPHVELFAGMCTLCGQEVVSVESVPAERSLRSAAPQHPGLHLGLDPRPMQESEQSFARPNCADNLASVSNDRCWDGWEIGSVCRGIVCFWDANDGWGKIKRLDNINTDESTPTGAINMDDASPAGSTPKYETTVTTTLPGHVGSTTVTRVSYARGTFNTTTEAALADKDIYVHNTQLPMDASRRWLQ